MRDDRPLILLGAGGHAKVALSLAHAAGRTVIGVCASELAPGTDWRGVPVLGGDEALDVIDPAGVQLINGIGMMPGATRRQELFQRLGSRGFSFATICHPRATVDPSARLAAGVQVMAGCVIQPDVAVGDNALLNTGSSVDHDCVIGAHVHIAPGATLCGSVNVGPGVFVGSGATIIQGIAVGAGAVIGAGTTVVRDLPEGATARGASPLLRSPHDKKGFA